MPVLWMYSRALAYDENGIWELVCLLKTVMNMVISASYCITRVYTQCSQGG